ncbi:hypothetical protein BDV98DRAFT_169527 [Pterulicium gracile]|uniref:Uncharacterized protein n=1 Tax=Pterulicium gracile TaxID=1884261 RepID=A0A5C3QBP1_9AGAR|nr:hypothetical protein BDV98DRAFT_169527 [Pterula gracilis]
MTTRVPFTPNSASLQTPKHDSNLMQTPRKSSSGLNGALQTTPSLGSRAANNLNISKLNLSNLLPATNNISSTPNNALRTNSIDSSENIINNNDSKPARSKISGLLNSNQNRRGQSSVAFRRPGHPRPDQSLPGDETAHDMADLGAHIPTLTPLRKPSTAPPVRFTPKQLRHEQSLERIAEVDEGDHARGSRHSGVEDFAPGMNDFDGQRYQSRSKSRSILVDEAHGMMTGSKHDLLEEYEQDEIEVEYGLKSKRIKLSGSRPADEYDVDPPERYAEQFQLTQGHHSQPMSWQGELSGAEGAMTKMFGSGVGDYLIQKMAGFGEEKARWANCSAEEWRDGTKDISQGFQQMMELVLDHYLYVSTLWPIDQVLTDIRFRHKTEKFAKVHETVDAHEKTIQEKEKALDRKRDEMVKSSKDFFV